MGAVTSHPAGKTGVRWSAVRSVREQEARPANYEIRRSRISSVTIPACESVR